MFSGFAFDDPAIHEPVNDMRQDKDHEKPSFSGGCVLGLGCRAPARIACMIKMDPVYPERRTV